MTYRRSSIFLLNLLAGLLATIPAFSATVVVGTCLPGKVSYDSLTDAVQGVPPGSTIQVCPGTYAEQIAINKSLTLKGISSGNGAYPVIVPPPGGLVSNASSLDTGITSFWAPGTPFAAQVLIEGGSSVTLTNLALDATGVGGSPCSPVVVGVLVQDSSATLTEVAVKNQLNPCATPAVGIGVLIQNDGSFATTMTVKSTTFVNAGQSFESDGASNASTLTNNSFAGNPASNSNAISIIGGSSAIQGNSITNFNYPPASMNVFGASFGILVGCVTGGTVANNNIAGTQVGVYVSNSCTTSGVSVTGNQISDAQLIGIDVGEINGLVQNNDISTSQTAIRFPGSSAGNTVQGNTINDACAAFGASPAAGTNTLLNNRVANAINLAIVNTTALCP